MGFRRIDIWIKYTDILGVALGQSIALGLCAAFGTLIPPIIAGDNLFSSTAGILTIIGVSITVVGIAVIGYAGALKSREMTEEEKRAAVKEFALEERNFYCHLRRCDERLF